MESTSHLSILSPAAGAAGRIRSHGFTLIEALITTAILAIMLAIALPSFDALVDRNRAQSTGKQLVAILQYARAQAQIGRQPVRIMPQTASDWGSLLLIKRLRGGNLAGHREIELRRTRLDESGRVHVASNESGSLEFDGNGIATGNTRTPRVFTLTAGNHVRKVCLQRSGMAAPCD